MTVRRNARNYDTSRWEDAGPLPDTGKEFVRPLCVEKTSGRKAVVKHVDLSRSKRVQSRFWDEALNMHRMSGTPGILPVWDVDDTRPDEPRWSSTPCRMPGSSLMPSGTMRRYGTSSATSPSLPMSWPA